MEGPKFCSNCGTKIEDGVEFCQNCGVRAGELEEVTNNSASTSDVKNYSPIFWKYFWIGVLLNVFSRASELFEGSGFWIIFIILVGIYIYKFSETINEAMLSIGRKNWWPLGLLVVIPFGFWVAFLIVKAKLKPHGRWVSKHKSFKTSKGL